MDSFWVHFALFLLYGCIVDVFATDFLRGIARELDVDFNVTYGKYRFHRFFRWLISTKTAAFMDNHSLFFPFIEIVTALFLAGCAEKHGILSIRMFECIAAATILLMATLIDLEIWVYPERLTFLLIGMGAFFSLLDGIVNDWSNLLYRLEGGFFGFGLLYLTRQFGLWAWRKEGVGIGDIVMCTGIGLFLGWVPFIVFFFSWPFLGLLYALWVSLRMRRYQRVIPTGPSYLPVFLICLLFFGTAGQGFIGIMFQDIDREMAKRRGMVAWKGVSVIDVIEGSPGAMAGVMAGDVILELNGESISSAKELRDMVLRLRPRKHIEALVLRKGERKRLTVTVGSPPPVMYDMFRIMQILQKLKQWGPT